MITTLRKITLLLGSGLLMVNLVSCNEDDEPCTDQTLAPLRLMITDLEDNNLLAEDSDYELADFKLFYQDGTDMTELTVAADKTADDQAFLASTKAAEESLAGNTEFELVLDENHSVTFDFVVTGSDASGCTMYTYDATDSDGEDLELVSDANPKPYLIQIDLDTE